MMKRLIKTLILSMLAISLASCAISPETQANMDEFAATIPVCNSDTDCQSMMAAARSWIGQNSDFPIRSESEFRIMATSIRVDQSGVGVKVDREAGSSGGEQIRVDVECFSAYGCPDIWAMKVDFNRSVNAASQ